MALLADSHDALTKLTARELWTSVVLARLSSQVGLITVDQAPVAVIVTGLASVA